MAGSGDARRWNGRLAMSAVVGAQVLAGAAVNLLTSSWNWLVLCFLVATVVCWTVLEVRRADPLPEPPPPGGPVTGSLVPPWGLRPRRIRGRHLTVGQLARLTTAPDGCFHVLYGLGGCGKTAIALETCARARARGLPTWWLRVPDGAALDTALIALARGLGADDGRIDQARLSTQRLLDLVWALLDDASGWVLVFDNVDAPEALTTTDVPIRDGNGVIRGSLSGLVLVTSRQGDPLLWGDGAVLHAVEPLTEADGAQVLLDDAGAEAGDAEAAAVLSRRLGGLPLGLRAAGRYLASTRAALDGVSSFAAYADALETRFGQLFPADVAGARPQEVVTATWELSLDLLAARGLPAARPLLRLITAFAAAPVPVALLEPSVLRRRRVLGRGRPGSRHRLVPAGPARGRTVVTAEAETQDVLAGLAALGLVSLTVYRASQPGTAPVPCLFVHPLLVDVNRHRMRADDAHRDTLALVAHLLTDVCRERAGDDPAEAPWWILVAPHFTSVLASRTLPRPASADLLPGAMKAVEGLRTAGSYAAAHDLARVVLAVSAEVLGDRHVDTLRSRNNLAEVLYAQGRWRESEAEHRTTLRIRQEALGPLNPDTLRSRNNLAEVLYAQGKWQESEVEHRNTLFARREVLGADAPDTLRSRANFAWVLKDLRRFDEAEAECREVLRASRRVCGADHPDTLTIHSDLAWILREQGRAAEAESEGRAVLADRTRLLGPDHPDTLGSRSNLAVALRDLGRLAEAECESDAVLRARARVLGEDHPDTLTSRSNHAAILLDQGRADEARAENEAVLVARCRTLGPDHPRVATSRRNLGLAQRRCAGGRDVEAADVTGY
ncbi:FxSxx-COOH system tetratricopeptide repeat protein [Streptomyces flavofungini]|uniref:Tetratricopeptide repeat protein n=1 Tax=Streptomyces flavofungini TaxID=68200 RepID=A0ABS0X759_9ACTN|nr:FxSxx-COOH system tetratricopeptide repeat protein [Streptomyces flavofungini]MBJ3808974.1 tetratricopeptide repeat protein [Streptomyces flavofungini]GHC67936.1 tetratricopeptide repeat protein [Streptomyces flavofungini]